MAELMVVFAFWVTPTWALEALDPYIICVEHFDGSECGCEAYRWPWENKYDGVCARFAGEKK